VSWNRIGTVAEPTRGEEKPTQRAVAFADAEEERLYFLVEGNSI
jgi:hypothetical protein